MSQANIETKVLIRGRDAAHMTDNQIFSLIGELEAEITTLRGISNKPKKLLAAIDNLVEDIDKLVKYVDERA